ncbi:hypothetical protein H0H92_010560 [Tricholoma furcatifolium]|nr:hypothetical protein H0H92_010560 [Tricholoma furcatifolium]
MVLTRSQVAKLKASQENASLAKLLGLRNTTAIAQMPNLSRSLSTISSEASLPSSFSTCIDNAITSTSATSVQVSAILPSRNDPGAQLDAAITLSRAPQNLPLTSKHEKYFLENGIIRQVLSVESPDKIASLHRLMIDNIAERELESLLRQRELFRFASESDMDVDNMESIQECDTMDEVPIIEDAPLSYIRVDTEPAEDNDTILPSFTIPAGQPQIVTHMKTDTVNSSTTFREGSTPTASNHLKRVQTLRSHPVGMCAISETHAAGPGNVTSYTSKRRPLSRTESMDIEVVEPRSIAYDSTLKKSYQRGVQPLRRQHIEFWHN